MNSLKVISTEISQCYQKSGDRIAEFSVLNGYGGLSIRVRVKRVNCRKSISHTTFDFHAII